MFTKIAIALALATAVTACDADEPTRNDTTVVERNNTVVVPITNDDEKAPQ